jgi:hypothetical protein
MDGAAIETGPGYVRLLDRVRRTEWHQASRPTETWGREIWRGRAAPLDVALYRHDPKESQWHRLLHARRVRL